MRTIFFFVFLLTFFTLNAQDTIVKMNGEVISAKILEVGTDEIKFKVFGSADGPVIIVKNSDVKTAKVAGQVVLSNKEEKKDIEDVIVKKNGDLMKVQVIDIGTDEVKFKLYDNPDGPTISVKKSEIKTMKVDGQLVIDVKKTGPDEDVILKKDGSSLKVKVIEVGSDEVKYKVYNNPDGPTLSVKKSEVQTVKIEGQVVYEYKEDPYSISNRAILDKASNLKFHFFSPLSHHIAFTFEWMNKPGFNWDAGFGIVGPGVSPWDEQLNNDPKGFFLRGGPKFLLGNSSEIEIEGAKLSHPLKGRFFKPELTLSALTIKTTYDTGSYNSGYGVGKAVYTKRYQSLVINLVYGRQFIFGNAITVSYYVGVGYGFESKSTSGTNPNYWYDTFDPRRYSYWYMGQTFPMTFTAGFTIGYIMRTPEWLKGKQAYSKPPTRRSMDE